MREELSQSANIKSKQTKKNVQSAIEVIMQRMKLFQRPPEKGLVLFVGMIPRGGPGTEKMETYMFYCTHNNFIMISGWYANTDYLYFRHFKYVIIINKTNGVKFLGNFGHCSLHNIRNRH